MNVVAVNGSPRKDWNTGTLLESALEGAKSVGAQTRLIHLYDLEYQGCTSCFSCKKKGNTCGGLCAMRDDLREVLGELLESDVLLLGSPIYFGDLTGETRSFLERLLFPNTSYDEFGLSIFPGRLSCGLILTMNCAEQYVETVRYDVLFQNHMDLLRILKGTVELLTSHETYQFVDYSAMDAAVFDVEAKIRWRDEVFPVEQERAFAMGARLAGKQE